MAEEHRRALCIPDPNGQPAFHLRVGPSPQHPWIIEPEAVLGEPRPETLLLGTSAQSELCTIRGVFSSSHSKSKLHGPLDRSWEPTTMSPLHNLFTMPQASQPPILWEKPSGLLLALGYICHRGMSNKWPSQVSWSQSSDLSFPEESWKLRSNGVPQEKTSAHATKHLPKLPSAVASNCAQTIAVTHGPLWWMAWTSTYLLQAAPLKKPIYQSSNR